MTRRPGLLDPVRLSLEIAVISIVLTDARSWTLPIRVPQYLEEQPDPTIAAISMLLILLALSVLSVGSRTVGLNRMIQG